MSVKEYLCTVCNGFIYKTPGTPLKTAERQITCNESLQFSDCSFCNLIITLLEELAPEWRNTNPPYTFEYQLDKTNSDLRRVLIFQFVDGWNTSDGRPYAADVMLYGNPMLPCFPYLLDSQDVANHSNAEQCFNFLQSQLAECQDSHGAGCDLREAQELPRRTLFVGTDTEPTLALRENSSIVDKYAALSYCWGSHQSYVLRNNNATQLQLGLEWQRLPRTLQDAISVTRKLNIQHIWIDALCIIQDDVDDWKLEAAKMGRYYQYAYITIAAASSPDSNISFLDKRKEDRLARNIRLRSCTHMPICELKVKPYHRAFRDREKSRLQTRGWTFQEHVLANRIAHYTESGIIWECRTKLLSEDGAIIDHRNFPSLQNDWSLTRMTFALQEEPANAWRRLITRYTERQLTFPADRLAAVAGLAARLQGETQWTYLAGLWKENLVKDLLWQSRWTPKPGSWERSPVVASPLAPSWTWCSVNGPIGHSLTPFWEAPTSQESFTQRSVFDPTAEVTALSGNFDDQDPVLGMHSGCISLHGPLLSMRLHGGNTLDRHSYQLHLVNSSSPINVQQEHETEAEEQRSTGSSNEIDEDDSAGEKWTYFEFHPDTILSEVDLPDSDAKTLKREDTTDLSPGKRQVDVPVSCLLIGKQRMYLVEEEDCTEMPCDFWCLVLAQHVDHPDKFIRVGLMQTGTPDSFDTCPLAEVCIM